MVWKHSVEELGKESWCVLCSVMSNHSAVTPGVQTQELMREEWRTAGCHKVLQRGNAVARHNIFCKSQNGKC